MWRYFNADQNRWFVCDKDEAIEADKSGKVVQYILDNRQNSKDFADAIKIVHIDVPAIVNGSVTQLIKLQQIDQLAKQARRDINHGRPPEAIKALDKIIELLKVK